MLMNEGTRPKPRASSAATSTSKPVTRSGCEGSASTNGAPPSGSPAHRRTRGGSAPDPTPVARAATISIATAAALETLRTAVDCTGRLAMANVALIGTGLLGSGIVQGLLKRG